MLGPTDGSYLLRDSADGKPAPEPTHVLVFTTLAAPRRRRRLTRRGRGLGARSGPVPAEPVASSRATVIEAATPLPDITAATAWFAHAGETDLAASLRTLARVLHSYSLAACDPLVHAPGREQLLVARVGYGDGEQVAHGGWQQARELLTTERRARRVRMLEPQAQLAAVLNGHLPTLLCQELALRARLDLDAERSRAAALELKAALDAALTELSDGMAPDMRARLDELSTQVEAVSEAAAAAVRAELSVTQRDALTFALGRLEAALRARSATITA